MDYHDNNGHPISKSNTMFCLKHSLLYIRPDSKSTMDALIADLLKMISINIRVN